jgi:hypothetical protein
VIRIGVVEIRELPVTGRLEDGRDVEAKRWTRERFFRVRVVASAARRDEKGTKNDRWGSHDDSYSNRYAVKCERSVVVIRDAPRAGGSSAGGSVAPHRIDHDQGARIVFAGKLAISAWAFDDPFMMERRQRRSSDRGTALQLFIAAQRERLAAEALTVMNGEGKTIAGVGEIDESRTDRMATWELRAKDEWLVVTSWGGSLTYEVGRGVRRIVESSSLSGGEASLFEQ